MTCETCKCEIKTDIQYITYTITTTKGVSVEDFCCGLCVTIASLNSLVKNQSYFDRIVDGKYKLGETWYPVINELKDQLMRVRGMK